MRSKEELPDPHEGMTPEEKGALLRRYVWLGKAPSIQEGRGACFSRAILSGANFHEANLPWIGLSEANLYGIDLSEANLHGADLNRADLSNADLSGANLCKAELAVAFLGEANLHGANLCEARLFKADLTGAKLREANLRGGSLRGANLSLADLRGADLRRTDLREANLWKATLSPTIQIEGCSLGYTSLTDVDLFPFCVTQVRHDGPSIIDHRSILRSLSAPRLLEFLCATGMPPIFATYAIDCARSLTQTEIFSLLQSTFITYGRPDEAFAEKLHHALERSGVRTYFFKEHAIPGEKLHRHLHQRIHEHDRLILVCSRHSLNRPGVLLEIETILAREAREGGSARLVPVRLDEYILDEWDPPNRPDLRPQLLDRVVADFSGTDTDETKFQIQLRRLLEALKR